MGNRFWPTAELSLGEDLDPAILPDPTSKAWSDVWIGENAKGGSGIALVSRAMVRETEEISPVIDRLRDGLRAHERDVAIMPLSASVSRPPPAPGAPCPFTEACSFGTRIGPWNSGASPL
ncbi:MAG: hypothetical protein IPI01_11615 [Ignavibacteriae bacterium]|nr:hypothetical protein [Ignavibacteriota bacterium]